MQGEEAACERGDLPEQLAEAARAFRCARTEAVLEQRAQEAAVESSGSLLLELAAQVAGIGVEAPLLLEEADDQQAMKEERGEAVTRGGGRDSQGGEPQPCVLLLEASRKPRYPPCPWDVLARRRN